MTQNSFSSRFWRLIAVVLLPLVGCEKTGCGDGPVPMGQPVQLQFSYVVGDDALPFHLDSTYLSASDDLVRIRHLKYYLTRVRFQRRDSSYWISPRLPALVQLGRCDSVILGLVPAGDYVSVAFDIGLDSATNFSTDQGYDLAPVHEMFWAWNTGYKFLLLEGEWLGSTPSSGIEYHIGRAPTLRTVRLPLPAGTTVAANASMPLTVRIAGRPMTIFGGPHVLQLRFPRNRNAQFDTSDALLVADNYAAMFTLMGVE